MCLNIVDDTVNNQVFTLNSLTSSNSNYMFFQMRQDIYIDDL